MGMRPGARAGPGPDGRGWLGGPGSRWRAYGRARMRYSVFGPADSVSARARAIGSAGERLVHTEEVTGSIPVSPTRSEHMSILVWITVGAIPVAKSAAIRCGADMAGRRGWGQDSIYFDHSGECPRTDNHRHCPGRCVAAGAASSRRPVGTDQAGNFPGDAHSVDDA
jgi:hypothetical protein